MTVAVDDTDFRLHQGDVLETLAAMADGSVDCVITSPPYWGLRDYGTGSWGGGDPDCDHLKGEMRRGINLATSVHSTRGGAKKAAKVSDIPYGDVCGKCGAARVDQQLGLEATPDLYVAALVAVFREVRRVLSDTGTLWLNLGDSYAAQGGGKAEGQYEEKRVPGATWQAPRTPPNGLKPKDLVGIPWRVAFALQADGWFLRSDIIWAKPNPMPESVTDRPTKSHEYVFLLAKSGAATYWVNGRRGTLSATKPPPDYWWLSELGEASETPVVGWGRENAWRGRDYFFDQEAVREPYAEVSFERVKARSKYDTPQDVPHAMQSRPTLHPNGRNVRSVWEVATQPYPEAHFATYPEELVRRCLLAGCPESVCRTCGKPRERLVETNSPSKWAADDETLGWANTHSKTSNAQSSKSLHRQPGGVYSTAQTVGWSDCGHGDYRPGVVFDPFLGSGTTALVARRYGRRCVGVELNAEYAELAARRLQQLSLLAEGAV
jgi:DNA modification methylase